MGNAKWTLAGCSIRLSEGTANRLLAMHQDGSATMSTGAETQSCTWEWKRTGMDAGVLTLVWPGGAQISQELEFLSGNSGVFVTREGHAGAPAPARVSAGTFQMNPPADITSTAPVSLENVRVDISGSGRPSGLVIGLANALQRSTPFGTESCEIFYERTGETSAVLRLANPSMQQEITLTFTGPGCGTCITRETRAGVLRRESEGTFTVTAQP